RTLKRLVTEGQRSTRSATSHLVSRPPAGWRDRLASPTYRRLRERLGRAIQETGLRKGYLRGQRQVVVGSYQVSRGFTRIRTSARYSTFTKHVETVTPPCAPRANPRPRR